MRRKCKSRAGVTIVEMLVAVILLAILTAGGVAATAAAMTNQLYKAEVSNAEILASTVTEAIANEVRLGSGAKVLNADGSGVANGTPGLRLNLDSALFGPGTTLRLDDTGRLVAETPVPGAVGGPPAIRQVLSEDAYAGLYLADLAFTAVPAGTKTDPADPSIQTQKASFTVSFTVMSTRSGQLWAGTVSVAPIAG